VNTGVFAAILFGLAIFPARAEEEAFERRPISYSIAAPHDSVATLKLKLAADEIRLEGDEKSVVRHLLSALGIPESSQLLVFSKTSFQKDRISPARPRAIYFGDEVYVGWCPGGLVEVASVDPVLGPVFYSFDPRSGPGAHRFERDPDCLRCHGGTFVRDIPGLLARSLFCDANGQPLLVLGTDLVDDSTPIEKRWGGWYVTALKAGPQHRGNLMLAAEQEPSSAQLSAGANLASLDKLVDTSPYLVPSSDVTALLVFEHQVSVQNALTRANQQCLRMMNYQTNLQAELKEAVTTEPTYESVKHSFSEAAQQVCDALLFKDAAALPPTGIAGVGTFVRDFENSGRVAVDHPALKSLDLHSRLFRYRCSYLIQSSSFDNLQPTLRRRVLQRLWRVLSEPTPDSRYEYLEPEERRAIRDLIASNVHHLPPSWQVTN
jgi:hypothetical protein